MPFGQLPYKLVHSLKRRPIVYVAVVLALLVLAGLVLTAQHYYSRSASLPCTENAENLLNETKKLYGLEGRGIILPDDRQELNRLAAKIKRQPRYEHDINCQYILANHYLYEDPPKAENALAKVKSLNADGQTISDELFEASIDRLEREIEIYKGAREDVINNTVPLPVTEEESE